MGRLFYVIGIIEDDCDLFRSDQDRTDQAVDDLFTGRVFLDFV